MENINTFWSILENYGVEIPPIQRDYAQGRETAKVSRVRNSFLSSITDALQTNKKLSLDFVYGKIYGLRNEEEHRRNKRAIQSLINSVKDYALTVDLIIDNVNVEDKSGDQADLVYLVPLDGQQRLTTLFLLHWYIAKKLGMENELRILNRFRYKTRRSSTAFIDLLTNSAVEINFAFENEIKEDLKEGSLFKEIINLEHFSLSWMSDPTVHSMLVVIQAIHYQLQLNNGEKTQETLSKYWINLTKEHIIYFDFLNLQDFNLSDDLYVKMNARGKQLSSFENFKAWLFNVVGEKKLVKDEDWEKYKLKFDIEWNDVFWGAKGNGLYKIDNVFLQYFKLMYIADYLKSMTVFQNKLVEEIIDDYFFHESELDKITITEFDSKGELVFDFDVYFDSKLFRSKVSSYLRILDLISDEGMSILDSITESRISLFNNSADTFSGLYMSEKSLKFSWVSFIERYLILKYIETKTKKIVDYSDLEKVEFQKYLRVMLNLLHNKIIANKHLYLQAIESIDSIMKNLNFSDVEKGFLLTDIPFFDESQIEEETIKLLLISSHENWRILIFKAEEHRYFKGQINFILKYAGIYELYHTDKSKFLENVEKHSDFLMDQFDSYYQKLNSLFDSNGLRKHFDNNIFKSAILHFGFYFVDLGNQKYHTLQNSSRDYSWKRMLGESTNDNEYSKKSCFIKNLIDNIADYNDIPNSLKSIVESNKNFTTHIDFLIHNPSMFIKCEKNLVRFHQDINSNGYAYLVKSVNVNYPKDKEIHLYALELELKNLGFQVKSEFMELYDNHFITKINNLDVMVSFNFEDEGSVKKSYYNIECGGKKMEKYDLESCINSIMSLNLVQA